MTWAPLDLAGRQFGRLTVIERAVKPDSSGRYCWLVRCACGTEKLIRGSRLVQGATQSCGCLAREGASRRLSTHGMSKTRTWKVWESMLSRCMNPANPSFKNYGGRGVRVCIRWMKFDGFLADMGHQPAGMSLDRIDTNGHYEASNCRWADWTTQARNKRSNHVVEFNGVVACIAEHAEKHGIDRNVVYRRIKDGWSVEQALTRPIRKWGQR